MDITLERILSLIPRKPDGKYVHGAKKEFASSLNLPHNMVTEWIGGKSKSYNNYLYEISAKYGVSVEWLKGETDEKHPFDIQLFARDKKELMAAFKAMSREELLEVVEAALEVLKEK